MLTRNQLKHEIKQHLSFFNENEIGKISYSLSRKGTSKSKKLINEVYLVTDYLNENVSLNERMYHLFKNLIEEQKCIYCKEPKVKFLSCVKVIEKYVQKKNVIEC